MGAGAAPRPMRTGTGTGLRNSLPALPRRPEPTAAANTRLPPERLKCRGTWGGGTPKGSQVGPEAGSGMSGAEGPGSPVFPLRPAPSASARPASPRGATCPPAQHPGPLPKHLPSADRLCRGAWSWLPWVCAPHEALSCRGFGSETRSGAL